MIAAEVAKRARDGAGYHVALRLALVGAQANFSGGPCTATVIVEKCYRGDDALVEGQSVRLEVFCYVPPDCAPTGLEWLDFSRMQPGATLEAFLDETGPSKFAVVLCQIAFTGSVGEEPTKGLWSEPPARAGNRLSRAAGWIGKVLSGRATG